MDLPGLQTIPRLDGNGLAPVRASPCWHRNESAHTDSVAARLTLRVSKRSHGTDVRTDSGTDDV